MLLDHLQHNLATAPELNIENNDINPVEDEPESDNTLRGLLMKRKADGHQPESLSKFVGGDMSKFPGKRKFRATEV
jgi:hypothetical protein